MKKKLDNSDEALVSVTMVAASLKDHYKRLKVAEQEWEEKDKKSA